MSPTFYIFILRGWSTFAGGVLLILIPIFLSPTEQGYYYTFNSLAGMQILFELGFTSIIVQYVAHEYAHLKFNSKKELSGPSINIARLIAIVIFIKRRYILVSIIFFVFASISGTIFFFLKSNEGLNILLSQWIALVLFASVNLYLNSHLALFEGLDMIGDVAKLRLTVSILAYFIIWSALALGAGLWISAILPAISAIGISVWIKKNNPIKISASERNYNSEIILAKEIFPLQWRIAISSASGYLIFSLFTPIIFANQGPIEAGKIGITITIFTTLHLLGTSWISAKVPVLPSFIAKRDWKALNNTFDKAIKSSIFYTALLCMSASMVIYVLQAYDIRPFSRIASFRIVALLAVVAVANTIIYSLAVYMRAFKKEPMLTNSISMAILVPGFVYYFSQYNITAAIAAYAALTIFVSLPWTIILYANYRKLHHSLDY